MTRFVALILMLSAAGPVLAQSVPPELHKTAWCGTLFQHLAQDMPPDPTAQQLQLVAVFVEAGAVLLAEASEGYVAAGFGAAQGPAWLGDMARTVLTQIEADRLDYSFEDCTELAGF